jgi:precorrin-6B methylase 2
VVTNIDSLFRNLPLIVLGSYDVPWVPTRRKLISHIMRIAGVQRGIRFYDLGCGDGRVVIEAAKRGALAYCIEIRRDLIEKAIENAQKEGVAERIHFINDNFFKVDLSKADVVYMYLLTRVNNMLKPKLESELRVGTRVVTLDFPVPGWKPVHVEKHYTSGLSRIIYLYIMGISNIPL